MNWLRRKPTIITAVSLIVVLVAAISLWNVSSARTFQFFGDLVDRVETTEKVVALTFDDGPDPAGAQQVLDLLVAENVPATFFLMGRDLEKHPELGRRIADAKHEIGNHTYNHQRMIGVLPSTVAKEVEDTDAQIRRTGYSGDIHFRPPNGKKLFALPRYLQQHDRTTVMWDVEPDSEGTPTAQEITQRTLAQTKPGSIILLHPMYAAREQTRQALKPVITGLKERGYRFLTVSALLGSR
ncbi:polysaccharide deacetylase family protein [Lentzea flaviverrucosa]|uniref:Peptidoglycan/xylan/chitin deacetylase, PgdA/CDA1 family n=1 Tax=Lentzea flaviverrucosa TaxID=200379 RepID=A0A1H9FRL7_9PSEU|nr:polysaccharide deacetylase family protein [Lentzea flaviverrucosa]RDI35123.1 peptidoglycan/xylan/chitin deacetylase (PgdA/CDA1 family) [Lentzea flaviverrucosa]SEQ40554.1 Peptidoglycan/xylan/chitin deacetylase, PgdA/CDA1 family [Lentzea flaviverrucosa]